MDKLYECERTYFNAKKYKYIYIYSYPKTQIMIYICYNKMIKTINNMFSPTLSNCMFFKRGNVRYFYIFTETETKFCQGKDVFERMNYLYQV